MNREDKLFKLRLAMDHYRKVLKNSLYPFQNLVIDESLMLFKGRVSFRQYIPSKRHRFDINFFIIVDCETGYILDFFIYTGASTEVKEFDSNLGKSGNMITSPLLHDALYEKKINCCGTVKANRMYMPKFQKRIEKGDVKVFSNKKLLALKWKDKRDIHKLTSIHNNEMRCLKNSRGENILKPAAVVDYNQNMGGVDKTDMLLSTTKTVRKCIKWYKKVFFHLLDLAVLNSHVVYKMKTGENIALLDFQ
ncbi:hypothetical protein JTB14_022237 [Gonioctena quinquepunctata]|nr:hypothetical protein JTB14_022237 [Gonioctena quinquepunctata]